MENNEPEITKPLPEYAFACAAENGYQSGMTLRDYFASKAMQAHWGDPNLTEQAIPEVARLSYAVADAMLAERSRDGKGR